MRKFNFLKAAFVELSLVAVLGLGPVGAGSALTQGGNGNVNQETGYAARFANAGRNSFLNVSTKAKGHVTWKQACDAGTHPLGVTVFAWGDLVVAVTATEIHAFARDGKPLWSLPKRFCSPAVLAEGVLWYQHPSHFLSSVDEKGQVVNDKESFPGALGDTEHVELLYPRKDHFIASDYDLNQRDHDEMTGVNLSSEPELEIRKNVFGYSYSALQKTFERTVDVPPLFEPKSSVVSLVSRGEIIQMDMTEQKKERRIPLPVEDLVEWSLLENGNYGLLGYEKGEKVVAEVGQSGDVLWRYGDAAGKDKWLAHPPITGPGGAVYVLTDQRVVAIKKGAAVWACDFGGTVQAGFACALADGSLLATHDGTLQHLDKNGKALFSLKLDAPIVSPPAVDKSGSIFVATASQLLRID
jgi:hypothetical protein